MRAWGIDWADRLSAGITEGVTHHHHGKGSNERDRAEREHVVQKKKCGLICGTTRTGTRQASGGEKNEAGSIMVQVIAGGAFSGFSSLKEASQFSLVLLLLSLSIIKT